MNLAALLSHWFSFYSLCGCRWETALTLFSPASDLTFFLEIAIAYGLVHQVKNIVFSSECFFVCFPFSTIFIHFSHSIFHTMCNGHSLMSSEPHLGSTVSLHFLIFAPCPAPHKLSFVPDSFFHFILIYSFHLLFSTRTRCSCKLLICEKLLSLSTISVVTWFP